jgi:hypothetical protein
VRLEHTFSTGTEANGWMAAWCGECVHDHGMHSEEADGCPIAARAIWSDEAPMVWQAYEIRWWATLPAGLVCRGFEQCPERREGRTFREALGLALPHSRPNWWEDDDAWTLMHE